MQGAFENANILVSKEGEVCIVNFDQATHNHCKSDPRLKVCNHEPDEYTYGCDEMFCAVQNLDLRTPGECIQKARSTW